MFEPTTTQPGPGPWSTEAADDAEAINWELLQSDLSAQQAVQQQIDSRVALATPIMLSPMRDRLARLLGLAATAVACAVAVRCRAVGRLGGLCDER